MAECGTEYSVRNMEYYKYYGLPRLSNDASPTFWSAKGYGVHAHEAHATDCPRFGKMRWIRSVPRSRVETVCHNIYRMRNGALLSPLLPTNGIDTEKLE